MRTLTEESSPAWRDEFTAGHGSSPVKNEKDKTSKIEKGNG